MFYQASNPQLDLQLTRGQIEDYPKVPHGAYLLATFDSEENVDKRWKSLVGQLAGLFCISLNQLDDGASFSPAWVSGFVNFHEKLALSLLSDKNYQTYEKPMAGQLPIDTLKSRRVGFLPREVACTENLTPWKKVLPTGSHSGLGMLLKNPHHQLKRSSFWSLGVKFSADESKQLELSHTMIVDVKTQSGFGSRHNYNRNVSLEADSDPLQTLILY